MNISTCPNTAIQETRRGDIPAREPIPTIQRETSLTAEVIRKGRKGGTYHHDDLKLSIQWTINFSLSLALRIGSSRAFSYSSIGIT